MNHRKVKYCSECKEKTVHEYAGKKTVGDGLPISRVVLAIGTMGFTEFAGATKYWECRRCGKILSE